MADQAAFLAVSADERLHSMSPTEWAITKGVTLIAGCAGIEGHCWIAVEDMVSEVSEADAVMFDSRGY